jgi:chemotaxis protein CheY-P-specific phosphatase CheC/CheY-like chemotaxis protein
VNVLICDDSGFARKQMTRCLPADWPIEISYASNGKEGLDVIRAGKGDLVFLDLNMPEMDGYEVLSEIQSGDLPAMSIVVSGDVQEEAYSRVKKLGALDFIQKPVAVDDIIRILKEYGIHETATGNAPREADFSVNLEEGYQELANIALGRAVKLLAQYLDVVVDMSIPHASQLELAELHMALNHIKVNDRVSAVSQGFIGGGISGEALLMFNDSNIEKIASLLHYDKAITDNTATELLMDIANILIGACLTGLSEQLDVRLSQDHPQILDRHVFVSDILKESAAEPALTIEMGCSIKSHDVDIEVLLMFTDESIKLLNGKLNYLVS